MGCASFGVTQIMVGLHRVGVVGLGQALRDIEVADLDHPEQTLDRLVARLAADNYIPDAMLPEYRKALWREVLRSHGADFSDLYSEVPVTVRGEPGEELESFLHLLAAVFAEHELQPVVELAPAADEGRNPQLVVADQTIVAGMPSRDRFKTAVRQSFSDW